MKKNILLKTIFFCLDLILIILSFLIAWKIRFYDQFTLLELIPSINFTFQVNNIFILNNSMKEYESLLFFIIITWSSLILVLDLLHVPRTSERIKNSFWKYIFYPQSILIAASFIWIVFFNYDSIPRLFLSLFLLFEITLLTISKKIRSDIFSYLRISGFDLIGLGIISNAENINKIDQWLTQKSKNGFFFKNHQLNDIYTNSNNDYIKLIDILNQGDYLLLDSSFLGRRDTVKITELAENKGIHVYKVLTKIKYDILKDKGIQINYFGSIYSLKSRRLSVKNPISIINKRIFDFLFSLAFILLVYWWVYLIVAIIIKIQSKGPILFKQERVGLDGDIFMCYKFRTMHIDNSNSKEITKVGDKRIFTFGHFLRKVNIDEFPQFINVFKGDMSVVGPRPHMVSEDKMLAQKIAKYRMRRWVKPGITGYAAMKGFRGGTESLDLMQQRINLDVKYIERWTFFLDIKICLDTILEIIFLQKKGH